MVLHNMVAVVLAPFAVVAVEEEVQLVEMMLEILEAVYSPSNRWEMGSK